jgi:hypothetical protein
MLCPLLADYHQGGHQLHHLVGSTGSFPQGMGCHPADCLQHAGSPYDNDGQAFFWAWEQAPHPVGLLLSQSSWRLQLLYRA